MLSKTNYSAVKYSSANNFKYINKHGMLQKILSTHTNTFWEVLII